MTLAEKRCALLDDLCALRTFVATLPGHRIALDQVKRTQAEADANKASGAGISNSLHLLGLAADVLLYVNGVYQTSTAAYAPLGAFWKSLRPGNCWGGDFRPKIDGNHFSAEHNGVR